MDIVCPECALGVGVADDDRERQTEESCMSQPASDGVTDTITMYRAGLISWDDLVAFFKTYPWRMPNLPDAGDYLGWDAGPDTFQEGTWGEVMGCHLDELL